MRGGYTLNYFQKIFNVFQIVTYCKRVPVTTQQDGRLSTKTQIIEHDFRCCVQIYNKELETWNQTTRLNLGRTGQCQSTEISAYPFNDSLNIQILFIFVKDFNTSIQIRCFSNLLTSLRYNCNCKQKGADAFSNG